MEATLNAVRRAGLGGSESQRLRRGGQLPAVVYGGDAKAGQPKALSIAVDPAALLRILRSESGVNTLIRLTVSGGATSRVLVREYQLDPISQKLLHVDFYRVAMDKAITVTVQFVLRGEAKGVKQQGGQLEFVHREMDVECLPAQIPEHLEVDVTELLIGQSVRVRDLLSDEVPWKPLSEPETMIVHVVAPKAEVTEEAPAEAAVPAEGPTEPEVIKKGKAEAVETEEEK
jgi:large subunit ribosomal protein L25